MHSSIVSSVIFLARVLLEDRLRYLRLISARRHSFLLKKSQSAATKVITATQKRVKLFPKSCYSFNRVAKNIKKLSTEIKLFSKNTCFYNQNLCYISSTKCPITLVLVFTYVVTSGRDMVCNSRCMTGTRNPLEIFGFPIMQSAFCFTYVEFLAAPTTSLIQNLTPAFPFKNCF